MLLPPNAISLPLKNAENAKLKKLNEKKLKLLKEKLKVIFSLHVKISAHKHTKTTKNIADLFLCVKYERKENCHTDLVALTGSGGKNKQAGGSAEMQPGLFINF